MYKKNKKPNTELEKHPSLLELLFSLKGIPTDVILVICEYAKINIDVFYFVLRLQCANALTPTNNHLETYGSTVNSTELKRAFTTQISLPHFTKKLIKYPLYEKFSDAMIEAGKRIPAKGSIYVIAAMISEQNNEPNVSPIYAGAKMTHLYYSSPTMGKKPFNSKLELPKDSNMKLSF